MNGLKKAKTNPIDFLPLFFLIDLNEPYLMKSSKKKNICFCFVSKYLNFANITWKTCNRWKEMYLNSPFISIYLRLLTIVLSISSCPPHSLVVIYVFDVYLTYHSDCKQREVVLY